MRCNSTCKSKRQWLFLDATLCISRGTWRPRTKWLCLNTLLSSFWNLWRTRLLTSSTSLRTNLLQPAFSQSTFLPRRLVWWLVLRDNQLRTYSCSNSCLMANSACSTHYRCGTAAFFPIAVEITYWALKSWQISVPVKSKKFIQIWSRSLT